MDKLGTADALAAARRGVVAVARPDLAVLPLGGADVLGSLHAGCTQHTEGVGAGDAAEALLLSPKGKIEFAFRLAVLPDGVLLDTEAEAAEALADRRARLGFRSDWGGGGPGGGGGAPWACSARPPAPRCPGPACRFRPPGRAVPPSTIPAWPSTAPWPAWTWSVRPPRRRSARSRRPA